jgi:Domain of unknown function (DUF6429)
MNINPDTIDEVILALIYLTMPDHNRAWKSFDWDVMDRLYERSLTGDPVNKTKSEISPEGGFHGFERLFDQHFVIADRIG